jgi:TetR/AcrR family transcriptional regulator
MTNTAPSHPATCKGLLSAARELFCTEAVNRGTSVREIAAAAGVTKPVLYYYFRSKEGVHLELFRKPSAKLAARLDEVSNGRGSAKTIQFNNRDHDPVTDVRGPSLS